MTISHTFMLPSLSGLMFSFLSGRFLRVQVLHSMAGQVSTFKEIAQLITRMLLLLSIPMKVLRWTFKTTQRALHTPRWCTETGCMNETHAPFNTPVWRGPAYHPADSCTLVTDWIWTPCGFWAALLVRVHAKGQVSHTETGDHSHFVPPPSLCLIHSHPLKFTFNRPNVCVGGGSVSCIQNSPLAFCIMFRTCSSQPKTTNKSNSSLL